jgi:hypothetical protein
MKYTVVKAFTDLQDENHVYWQGDSFPRKGRAKKERIEELSTDQNARGEVLIQEVAKDNEPQGDETPNSETPADDE